MRPPGTTLKEVVIAGGGLGIQGGGRKTSMGRAEIVHASADCLALEGKEVVRETDSWKKNRRVPKTVGALQKSTSRLLIPTVSLCIRRDRRAAGKRSDSTQVQPTAVEELLVITRNNKSAH